MLDIEHHEPIDRRTALLGVAAALFASCVFGAAPAAAGKSETKPGATEQEIREYLRPLLLTREDVRSVA